MTVAVVLSAGAEDEPTVTALRLAERLLARGHRITVFAHGRATTLSTCGGDAAGAVASLIRSGVHGGTLDWVSDSEGAGRFGCEDRQVTGVVVGDHADLWSFIRDARLVLSPGGGA